MLAGDFRDFAGAGCNGRGVTLDAPFVDNQIDPAMFSSAAVKFASFLPTSNDPCGEVSFGDPLHDDWETLIGRIDSGGTAGYNGLVLSLQRRPLTGVSFNMNYTWSHCITDPQQDVVNGGYADNGWNDANNRRFDRGDCSVAARDVRHLFNLSGVASSPEFSNRALQVIAGNWSLSPILRINTGRALTATNRRDTARNFMRDQRPDVVMDNIYGDKDDPSNYLNADARYTGQSGRGRHSGTGPVGARCGAVERLRDLRNDATRIPGRGVQPDQQHPVRRSPASP